MVEQEARDFIETRLYPVAQRGRAWADVPAVLRPALWNALCREGLHLEYADDAGRGVRVWWFKPTPRWREAADRMAAVDADPRFGD